MSLKIIHNKYTQSWRSKSGFFVLFWWLQITNYWSFHHFQIWVNPFLSKVRAKIWLNSSIFWFRAVQFNIFCWNFELEVKFGWVRPKFGWVRPKFGWVRAKFQSELGSKYTKKTCICGHYPSVRRSFQLALLFSCYGIYWS